MEKNLLFFSKLKCHFSEKMFALFWFIETRVLYTVAVTDLEFTMDQTLASNFELTEI